MNTIDMFRNATDAVAFDAGQVIFREGDAGDTMYVVTEGEVEIRVRDKVMVSAGAGGIFGEMALIDEAPRSATAVAKTACRLVPINRRRFTFLVQQTPFFALSVMRIMSERLRQRLQGC
jgi:CRP-like cAMP-binding protein